MSLMETKNVVSKIASKYPVISIDLFGSHASNEDTSSSDLDLIGIF